MAKTFLTNINLKGNQLLNAVIHSASSAPSALAAGQLYFNTGDNTFYYSTGTGTGNWSPVGVQYISTVGSNLSVTDGQLNISTDPVFNTVTANQDGIGENYLVGNDAWIGDINVPNTINIKGNEDPSQGYISFGSNYGQGIAHTYIGFDNNNLTIANDNNDIIIRADGWAYLWNNTNPDYRIATIGDINSAELVKSVDTTNFNVDSNGQLFLNNAISVNEIDVNGSGDFTVNSNGNVVLNPASGQAFIGSTDPNNRIVTVGNLPASGVSSVSGTENQISVNQTTGDVTVSLPSYIEIPNGEVHVRKNEYWQGGNQYGIVAANNNSSEFSIASVNYPLHLESHSGDIILSPDSGNVQVNGGIRFNNGSFGGYQAYQVVNGNTDFQLDSEYNLILRAWHAEADVQIASGSGTTVFSVSDSNDQNTPTPIDSSTTIVTDNTNLTVNAGGNILLSPQGNVVTIGDGSTTYGEIHLKKTEYWDGGTQYGVITNNGNTFKQVATSGNFAIESNNGDVRINPSSTVTWFNNNLNINGDGGVISTDVNSLHLNADNGVITTDAQEFHTTKVELWNGGDTSGSRLGLILAHPSDGSLSVVASNQMVLEAHSGDINLYPDGNAYIGSSTDGNRIATISDVHSVAQGLYVLGSVRTATGSNIDINANASTPISGVTLVNGDRVLVNSQSTATENGIYIYSSESQTLVPSTNAEDAALKEGSYTLVTEGTYAAQGYIVTLVPYSNATIWTQFSAAGEYTFTSGVYLDGNTVRVDYEGLESQLVTDGFALTSNYTTVTRKYAYQIVPDGSTNSYIINHGLNTEDVIVRVWDSATGSDSFGQDVEVDVARSITDLNNTVQISFASSPLSGTAYSVVVIG